MFETGQPHETRSRTLAAATRTALLIATLLAALFSLTGAKSRGPEGVREADRLAGQPPSAARDREIVSWSERAPLAELMYVLRRRPSELGETEAALTRAALERAPATHWALRSRLAVRLAMTGIKGAKDAAQEIVKHGSLVTSVPRASVFRIGVVVPDSGDYRDYAGMLFGGLTAAVAEANLGQPLAIEIERFSSHRGDPANATLAADSASARCGALVGDLLSLSTFPVAAIARARGVPLVSPTATDESIGRVSSAVFQIGPSAARRGQRLALAALESGARRFARVVSSAVPGSVGDAFEATIVAGGGAIVWRNTYAPGQPDFRPTARALAREHVDALFWDGESPEAATLCRHLASERVSVRIFGTEALDPDRHHLDARTLLAGVTYVGDDWELPPSLTARLDSVAVRAGDPRASGVFVRGWLAGRSIAAAVRGGALTPEDIAARLASGVENIPGTEPLGFLDLKSFQVRAGLRRVERGRGVPLP